MGATFECECGCGRQVCASCGSEVDGRCPTIDAQQVVIGQLCSANAAMRVAAAQLCAWLESGNAVPIDLPFVFREHWERIAADIRALAAAAEMSR